MQYFDSQPLAHHALAQLQDAARIASDDDLWLHRRDVGHFAVQQLLGRVGRQQVRNPRAPTTPLALRDFEQVELWDLPEHLAGLLTDFLSVQEMTRIIIGHA